MKQQNHTQRDLLDESGELTLSAQSAPDSDRLLDEERDRLRREREAKEAEKSQLDWTHDDRNIRAAIDGRNTTE